jgi:hypothetical protein
MSGQKSRSKLDLVTGPTATAAKAPQAVRPTVVPRPVAKPRATARKPPVDAIATLILCAIPVAITVWGWSYYSASRPTRLRHPLHALLKPSDGVGLALGITALALFLFMWLYPLRKSIRALAWTGSVGSWIRVHIVAGLSIPLIAAAHAGWRFDGLIGLGYLSMLVVSLSGIVGRYLYVHIPRSRNGLELTMEEVSNERRALITDIAAATGLVPADVERRLSVDPRPYQGLDPVRTIARMVRDDWARGRALRQLERDFRRTRAARGEMSGKELRDTMRLARREMTLTQQVRMLDASRTVFGYWHVAHRPFAITALLAVVIHVVVAIAIGGVGPWTGR